MKHSVMRLFTLAVLIFLSSCNDNNNTKESKDRLQAVEIYETKYDSTIFEKSYRALLLGDSLPKADISEFCNNPDTRADFYFMLKELHKESLFPLEYYSFKKAAESQLTTWLEYPTELDTVPSKIEFVENVRLNKNDSVFVYYVFRFRTEAPHWASKDGWMLGTVGPYFIDSEPYDWTKGTFSRFNQEGSITPREEVEWTHLNVYEKSP